MKVVKVLDGDSACSVKQMFQRRGWDVQGVDTDSPPDLVVFTGGADVSPSLYGEENTASHCDPARDAYEQVIYEETLEADIPMVGICRGGQFLNVMNGGKMIQDIPKIFFGRSPVSGDIKIVEPLRCPVDEDGCGDLTGCQGDCYKEYEVRVDHHQGMVRHENAEVIHTSQGGLIDYTLFYRDTNCLCFQPHPEWGHRGTEDLFFDLLDIYFDFNKEIRNAA